MNLKIIAITVLLTSLSGTIFSQSDKVCAYSGYMTVEDLNRNCSSNSYLSNQQAEEAIDNILSKVGLFRNFIIKECPNISNAVAATLRTSLGTYERYIIYDSNFLNRVIGTTGTDWSAISILAHEVGHHLNGHNLNTGMGSHEKELQADEFSGFVLAKMGASLDESLRAMNKFGSENSSDSHPNKYLRVKSITKGWRKANGGNLNVKNDSNIVLYDYNESQSNYYLQKGSEAYQNKNYELAGEYFLKAFQYNAGINKLYLYYVASAYVGAQDYDKAQKYYLMLLKNGIYSLEQKNQRKVYKNVTLIYAQQNKTADALNFIKIARRESPNDLNLLLTEANLYYKTGNKTKFAQLLKDAIAKDPYNSDLYYNLGVINAEQGEYDQAKYYYEQALRINGSNENANLNMASLILSKENEIIDEMNSLGSSNADNKRYDYLSEKRKELYKSAVPYLQKVIEINSQNTQAIKTLINIYYTIGDKNNAEKLKKRLN